MIISQQKQTTAAAAPNNKNLRLRPILNGTSKTNDGDANAQQQQQQYDDDLSYLEQGRKITIMSSKEDAIAADAAATSTTGDDGRRLKNNRSKEREAVALNAFNKARLASSSSSSTTHNNNNSSSNSSGVNNSRESSAASSDYVHKNNHNNVIENDKVPQQHSKRKSSLEINDEVEKEEDDENISLNSEDLLNAGGFDGSMTISDFQLDQQQLQKHRHLQGSLHNNNDSTRSSHDDSSQRQQKKKYHGNHSINGSNNSQKEQRLREEGGVKVGGTSTTTAAAAATATAAANEKRSNNRIRTSSSITSLDSTTSSKIMSSISGIFNPISKRRQQQQQTPRGNNGLIRNDNRRRSSLERVQQQQQQQLHSKQNQHLDGSWKDDSSSHSITTQNTMNSILMRKRKQQHRSSTSSNRVSWQLRNNDEDLANELLAATGKPDNTSWANAIIGGGNSNKNDRQSTTTATRRTTSSLRSSKRNSSWTIADLEEGLLRGSLNSDESSMFHIGGMGGAGSAHSILTPEEQQLWASKLQLANLKNAAGVGTATSTTIKTDKEDGSGGSDTAASSSKMGSMENNMAKSMDRKVVQEAMNLAAAAILQTSVKLGHDDECEAAGVENDACWYGGMKGMKGKVNGDISSNSPPGRTSDGGDEADEDGNKTLSSQQTILSPSVATDAPPTEEQPSLLNQSSPLSQASPQRHATPPISPTEITPATAVAVTTLAYQEVEDYRTRLRRKREEMEGIDSSFTSQQSQQQQQAEQLSDLNELLLENATNINNAVLLQRALYALRIHRGSLTTADGNTNNVVDSSDHTAAASRSVSPSRNHSLIRTSRSEHTGLDQLALDHLLNLSTSLQSSASGRTGSGENTANINSSWTAGTGNTTINGNHSSGTMERRHTEADAQQPGAYHQNEPAPLLFRRTFAHPNRRQNRDAQRRSTMDSLNIERASQLERASQHSGSSTPQHQRHHRNRTSSLDSGSASLNSSHCSSEHNNMDEGFANTLQYSPTSNNSAADTYITARVTPYITPDDGYNRRHLGTLLESTQSQQSNSSISSNNPRNLLLTAQASVRRQSLRARQMIQAVLVSDEIVEADRIHDDCDDENMIFPSNVEQMEMMEELLEEKEEEVRIMEERYRRRERVWMVAVTILVLAVIALIVTMVLTNR